MDTKLTFHINNMAYTISVDNKLREEITRFLPTDKNIDTKDLLAAFIRISQEHVKFKNQLEEITDKLPNL